MKLMKTGAWAVAAGCLLCGCARSTLESRKQERYGSYTALAPEAKSLVDQGQIKVGMPMDAVYIAWGKPSQAVSSEGPEGAFTTWIYQSTALEPYTYWVVRPYVHSRYGYGDPYLAHDYYVRTYVSAEVVFQDGKVKRWSLFPSPVY